jgi:2-hydroxy-3-oxopropionate reductase
MVGGPEKTFDAMLPILEKLGRNIVHIGECSACQVAKLCNQIVVGITIEAVAEALALAEASGVDAAKVRQALLGGFAQSRVLDVHGQRMLGRQFAPGFKAMLYRKYLCDRGLPPIRPGLTYRSRTSSSTRAFCAC